MCERLVIMTHGVEHHFNDAIDVAIRWPERADIHAKAACNRGADLLSVQLFPLNVTGLKDIGGQRLENGFLTQIKSEGFHVACQPALPVADIGERLGKLVAVPAKLGPAFHLVDIYSPHILRVL